MIVHIQGNMKQFLTYLIYNPIKACLNHIMKTDFVVISLDWSTVSSFNLIIKDIVQFDD